MRNARAVVTILASALLLAVFLTSEGRGCSISRHRVTSMYHWTDPDLFEPGEFYYKDEAKTMSVVATTSKACPGIRCPCEGYPAKATTTFTYTWTKTKSHTPITISAVVNAVFQFLTFNLTGGSNPDTETYTATQSETLEASASCGQIGEIATGTLSTWEEEYRTRTDGSATKNQSHTEAIRAVNVHFRNQTWDPCTGEVTPTQGQGCP